jgi:membrane associated rhomboid family serine protease
MGLYNRDYMREPSDWRERPWSPLRWSVVGWMLVAITAVFAAQWMLAGGERPTVGHVAIFGEASWEGMRNGHWWRLLTYPFVHAGPIHLALNLLGLWFIGRLARQEFGARHWLGIFFAGGVLGAIAYVLVFREHQLVGASASVYALLAAATVRLPHLPIGLPFLPGLTVRLRNLTLGVLTFDLISAIAQCVAELHPQANVLPAKEVASLAHLGGAFAGFLYVTLVTNGFNAMVRESDRRERLWREERVRRREPSRVAAGRVSSDTETSEPPAVDFMEHRVNPILEKLHSHGPGSLSQDEQRILNEAARRLRKDH